MAREISREEYAARYGPTAGDRIRLGDTNLIALIERDETSYGDEVLRGWGKTMRTGLMMNDRLPAASELDLLISNVIVIDPVLGVVKASIGVKDGLIVGRGPRGQSGHRGQPRSPHRLGHRAGVRPGLHRHARRRSTPTCTWSSRA